jgi:ferric-dicitrate binding protein FerR (iron transport regulator)
VILPDNSSVLLKPGTELTIDAGYGMQSRIVHLNGEAHFEVEPLRVAAQEFQGPGFTVDVAPPAALAHLFKPAGIAYPATGLHIEVTGTSFDVRAKNTDTSIRAMLLHGAIVIRRPNSAPESLEPGHAYILGENGRPRIMLVDDLVGPDYWKKDEFDFNNKPVGAIMAELSRWYGVPIVCPANFTDSFVVSGPRSQRINFILDQLKATRHFNYVIIHDTIYVSR